MLQNLQWSESDVEVLKYIKSPSDAPRWKIVSEHQNIYVAIYPRDHSAVGNQSIAIILYTHRSDWVNDENDTRKGGAVEFMPMI